MSDRIQLPEEKLEEYAASIGHVWSRSDMSNQEKIAELRHAAVMQGLELFRKSFQNNGTSQ